MSAPDLFKSHGLTPHRWSNGPGAVYPAHEHPYTKVLVCSAGSITFRIPTGEVTLGPGDDLTLPAGTPHSAIVGEVGVTCWEAAAG